MKNFDTILESTGLSPSERTVYSVARGKGSLRSSEIITLSKLPRPTVMSALKSLEDYKLCSTSPIDGRSLGYTMQPLQNLKMHLGLEIEKVESLIHDIDELPEEDYAPIQTLSGNGQEELRRYLELALRCKSRQWRIMAPRDNALSHMPKEYIGYFKRTRSEQQISSQTLWEHSASNQSVDLMNVLMRKPRYIPADTAKRIPSILLSFDDSILFISGTKQPSCTLVTNADVAVSFAIIFDLGWRSCRHD